MYRITYKDLETGKYTTIVDQDQASYERHLYASILMQAYGAIKIEATGEIKEIKIKEDL